MAPPPPKIKEAVDRAKSGATVLYSLTPKFKQNNLSLIFSIIENRKREDTLNSVVPALAENEHRLRSLRISRSIDRLRNTGGSPRSKGVDGVTTVLSVCCLVLACVVLSVDESFPFC